MKEIKNGEIVEKCEKCGEQMAHVFGDPNKTPFCKNKECEYFELLPKGIKAKTPKTDDAIVEEFNDSILDDFWTTEKGIELAGRIEKALNKLLTTKDQEIVQQLLDIEAERWKDAQHCTCLGYAIVTIFGDEYEEKIKKCREDSKCKHGEIKKVVDTIITTHNTGKDEEMKYSRSPLTGELRPTFINRDELLKALK